MRIVARVSLVLGIAVALVAAAVPAHAAEGHCDDAVVEAPATHHVDAAATAAVPVASPAAHEPCPDCATPGCDALYGCAGGGVTAIAIGAHAAGAPALVAGAAPAVPAWAPSSRHPAPPVPPPLRDSSAPA
jgi:hypothetical protein